MRLDFVLLSSKEQTLSVWKSFPPDTVVVVTVVTVVVYDSLDIKSFDLFTISSSLSFFKKNQKQTLKDVVGLYEATLFSGQMYDFFFPIYFIFNSL